MKNYRVLRIYAAAPYQNMFSKFYYDNKLEDLSYAKAVEKLCNSAYVISGNWSQCMRNLGNEAFDVIPDFPLLQKKWADENGLSDASTLEAPLLIKQIEVIKPDVIFFYAGGWSLLSDGLRRQLKSRYPFIKVITGLWGDPLPPNANYSKFQDADLLFCAYEHNIRSAKELNIPCVLNGNCFDPSVLEQIPANSEPLHDFIFAGSSGYSFPDHVNRYLGIIQLIKEADLKIWGYEPKISKKFIIRDFLRDSLTKGLSSLPPKRLEQLRETFNQPNVLTNTLDKIVDSLLGSRHPNRTLRLIREALKPPAERYGNYKWDRSHKPISKLFPSHCSSSKFGIGYFELLKSAKIVFNRHTGEAIHAGNIRMFEVTGMGSCLITDNPEESKRHFQLDEEIVAYHSIDECIEKVKYLLSNEKKRAEIARKGRERTMRDHTLMNRCKVIHDSLQKLL